jgi:type I restriction-modification system DNA methylase subunit
LYGTVESHQLKAGKVKDVHLCTCHVFIEIINTSEGEIRKNIIDADLVDCMIALPGQLFYTTQIPVCLWFVARNKKNGVGADDHPPYQKDLKVLRYGK